MADCVSVCVTVVKNGCSSCTPSMYGIVSSGCALSSVLYACAALTLQDSEPNYKSKAAHRSTHSATTFAPNILNS